MPRADREEIAEVEREDQKLKEWERANPPCGLCAATGRLRIWGQLIVCPRCKGEKRTKANA